MEQESPRHNLSTCRLIARNRHSRHVPLTSFLMGQAWLNGAAPMLHASTLQPTYQPPKQYCRRLHSCMAPTKMLAPSALVP